jgi:hypothetical protein
VPQADVLLSAADGQEVMDAASLTLVPSRANAGVVLVRVSEWSRTLLHAWSTHTMATHAATVEQLVLDQVHHSRALMTWHLFRELTTPGP